MKTMSHSHLFLWLITRKLYNVAHLSSFCSRQGLMDKNSFLVENYIGFFSLPVSCGWEYSQYLEGCFERKAEKYIKALPIVKR